MSMRSPPVEPTAARFWAALAPALLVPLLASLCYFVWFTGGAGAQLYALSRVFLVFWPLIGAIFILRQSPPCPHILDRRHWRALPLGAAVGAVLAALIVALALFPALAGSLAAAEPAVRAKAQAFGIIQHYWIWAVGFSILHAALEEYYWRWFVYGRLRAALAPWVAHAASALGFAAHHVVIASVFLTLGWGLLAGAAVAAAGFLWNLMYQRQGSLAGVWVSHLAADMALAWLGYRILFG